MIAEFNETDEDGLTVVCEHGIGRLLRIWAQNLKCRNNLKRGLLSGYMRGGASNSHYQQYHEWWNK